MAGGGKSGRGNLFAILRKHTQELTVDGARLTVAVPELALLDGLLLPKSVDRALLDDFLRKYGKQLDAETIGALTAMRYISAVNRLKHLAMERGDARLYEICLQSVKKQGGGCFLSRRSLGI